MANRYMNQFLHSFRKKLTFVEGNFVVGSAGAVGTVKGMGVTSVTHTSTGLYRITFDDAYPRYLGGTCGFIDSTGSVGSCGIFLVQIKGNPNTTIASKYLDLFFYNAAGSLADPANGTVVGFLSFFDNTSVLPSNEQ